MKKTDCEMKNGMFNGKISVIVRKIVISSLLLSVIFIAAVFSGCVGDDTPESVLEKEVKYIDSGKYAKLIDLYVNPDTLEPYSQEETKDVLQTLVVLVGPKGENIKVHEFKIIKKEKITDEKYLITTYTKATFMDETEEETETRTVVKVNGKWKIAEELPTPGFGALFGIAALIGCAYLIRKRKC
jgi:PGF-CTERM protein